MDRRFNGMAIAFATLLVLAGASCSTPEGHGTDRASSAAESSRASENPALPKSDSSESEATARVEIEALARAISAAGEKGDLVAFAECVAPQDRAFFSYGMLTVVSLTHAVQPPDADEAAKQRLSKLQSILDEYKIPATADIEIPEEGLEPAQFRALIQRHFAHVDHLAFLREVSDVLGPIESGAGVLVGALRDLRISGDRAHAQIGEEAVQFVRQEGRWYLGMSEE